MPRKEATAVLVPWLAVLGVALVVITPLLGAPPYGDDIRLHIYRVPVVEALWTAGVPFARWLPTLNLGYGSPLFNFYPPLSAYVLTLLYLILGQQVDVAWNVLLALALLGGCVGMFLLGRWLFGVAGGILAAMLYTWSPHLVYQGLARGSSANGLAMALFPWATWGLLVVGARPSPLFIVLASVPIALLMLSHTAASLLFLGPLVILAGTAVWATPGPRRPRLRAVVAALALGLALSAFSWLPALAEIGATRYALEAGKVNVQDYFADALRWPQQTVAGAHNPGLPKTPGIAQIALGAAGGGLAFVTWRRQGRGGQPTAVAAVATMAGLMGLGTLALAMSVSSPLWGWLRPLQSLQFPWRLLDIPTFCLALAGGFVLAMPFGHGRSWGAVGRGLVMVAGLVVAFLNVLPYLYPPRLHVLPEPLTLAEATAVQQQFGIYGLTAWGEYSAASVSTWPTALPFAGADEMLPLYTRLLETPAGMTAVAGDPWRAVWQTNLPQAETVTLAVHDFPGWQGWVDGKQAALGVAGDGRLQFTIPPGPHQVELAFTRTPARWLADGLTGLGLVVMVALFIGRWRYAVSPKHGFSPERAATNRLIVLFIIVLCLLLGSKLVWFDRTSSPLVVHPADGRIPGKVSASFGNFDGQIRLLAYETHPPDTLVLYWQALADMTARYAVVVTIGNAQGVPLDAVVNDAPGYMSTAHWQAGHLARDVYHLRPGGQPAPAGYTLWVEVKDAASGQVVPIVDAPGVTAVPVGRLKTPPTLLDAPETHGTVFGEVIRLRQAIVPAHLATGEAMEMTLVWESLAPVAEDYTVFVHLLNPDGTLADGNDGQPLHGRYPTSYWSPGEKIVDVRQWQPDVPPGIYQLAVGLYRLDSGERLATSGPLAEMVDRVMLGYVAIGESGSNQ